MLDRLARVGRLGCRLLLSRLAQKPDGIAPRLRIEVQALPLPRVDALRDDHLKPAVLAFGNRPFTTASYPCHFLFPFGSFQPTLVFQAFERDNLREEFVERFK